MQANARVCMTSSDVVRKRARTRTRRGCVCLAGCRPQRRLCCRTALARSSCILTLDLRHQAHGRIKIALKRAQVKAEV